MPLKPNSGSQINSHGEGWGKHMPSPPFEAMVWLAFAASAIFIAYILQNHTFAKWACISALKTQLRETLVELTL